MITLEKIIELDDKITRAVKVIEELRSENKLLKNKLGNNRKKIVKLEELLSTFKDDQDEIEAGIKNAVDTLSNMLSQDIEDLALISDDNSKAKPSELKKVDKKIKSPATLPQQVESDEELERLTKPEEPSNSLLGGIENNKLHTDSENISTEDNNTEQNSSNDELDIF